MEKAREQILSIHFHISERGTIETQQWIQNSIADELQRSFECLEERRQRVGRECFDNLEHKANEVVSFKQRDGVQDTTGDVFEVQTGEGVDLASIASNAGQDWVFQEPSYEVKIELDEAVVYWSSIPVGGNLFVALLVAELAILFVDGVETGENILCYESISINSQDSSLRRSGLTQMTSQRIFFGVVAQYTSSESISGVASNHARVWAIIEVWVDRDTVLESLCCTCANIVHGENKVV